MHRRTTRDADLVGLAQAGDLAAFERLVTRHRTSLLDLARQLVNDREAAQDLVQETLLRAYRALPQLHQPDSFGPWVNTILRRLGRGWQRDGARRPEPWEAEVVRGMPGVLWGPPPEPPDEVVARVRAALAVLTERERRAMILHYLEGLSCEEIAGRLRITNASVRRLLHYSRHKVRTEVETMQQAEGVKSGPRRLMSWISGDMSGAKGPTEYDYLKWRLAQSICLSVNKQAKSLTQMAEQVGAELAYVEDMAQGLTAMEILRSPKPKQYVANFIAFDAGDWRQLTALTRQPAGAAAQRLAAAESRVQAAFEKTPLAKSGWSWEDVKWPMYALVLCNVAFQRNLAPEHRPPWPLRPGGGRYWLGGYEEPEDATTMWMTGFNLSGGAPLAHGWLWVPGVRREYPTYFSRAEVGVVASALAGGPRTERDLLVKLGDDPERWRGALAELVGQELAVREKDTFRLTFPVFRGGDSEVLLGEADAVMRPIVREIAEPTFADLDKQLAAMGYGAFREQYPQWHAWFASGVMGEAVRFLLEQGVLPRPADPAPRSFCFIAWEPGLPLMEWGFGN